MGIVIVIFYFNKGLELASNVFLMLVIKICS